MRPPVIIAHRESTVSDPRPQPAEATDRRDGVSHLTRLQYCTGNQGSLHGGRHPRGGQRRSRGAGPPTPPPHAASGLTSRTYWFPSPKHSSRWGSTWTTYGSKSFPSMVQSISKAKRAPGGGKVRGVVRLGSGRPLGMGQPRDKLLALSSPSGNAQGSWGATAAAQEGAAPSARPEQKGGENRKHHQ